MIPEPVDRAQIGGGSDALVSTSGLELAEPFLISVVDDDASIRVALDDLLQSLGYDVQTFGSARQFLQSDRLSDSACVISDVTMPEMNGVELFEELQRQGNQTPFIFITAFPKESLARQALRAGAASFLIKPFKKDELVECIENALRLAGQ
jgi:FixJ family two-component response regulator